MAAYYDNYVNDVSDVNVLLSKNNNRTVGIIRFI